jgi:hypothetical protein
VPVLGSKHSSWKPSSRRAKEDPATTKNYLRANVQVLREGDLLAIF